MRRSLILTAWLSTACQLVPTGPSALPARPSSESLTAFRADDRVCRGDAQRAIGQVTNDLQQRYDGEYLHCMASAPRRPGRVTYFPPQPPLPLGATPQTPSFGPPPTVPGGVPSHEVALPGISIQTPSGLM